MDTVDKIITETPQETAKLGETIGNRIRQALSAGDSAPSDRVYCLYGDLGAGKTTFTQGLAKGLGISVRMLSPTFIIVRRYQIPQSEGYLYHVDIYRLHEGNWFEDLGFAEMLADPKSCVVIEWADKLGINKPQKRTDVTFVSEEQGHSVEIHTYI